MHAAVYARCKVFPENSKSYVDHQRELAHSAQKPRRKTLTVIRLPRPRPSGGW
jgi:hypothetical protein